MRWILIILAVLAALVVAIVVVGMMLPQNHTASRTARLSAAPQTVWNLITDVDAYPSWRGGVDSVQKIESGSRMTWREISKNDRITFEALVEDAPSHFVAHIADKGLPYGGSWDYKLSPDGSGTRITITENGEVYNPVFRFVSKYVIGHTTTIEKYLKNLSTKVGDTYTPGSDGP